MQHNLGWCTVTSHWLNSTYTAEGSDFTQFNAVHQVSTLLLLWAKSMYSVGSSCLPPQHPYTYLLRYFITQGLAKTVAPLSCFLTCS